MGTDLIKSDPNSPLEFPESKSPAIAPPEEQKEVPVAKPYQKDSLVAPPTAKKSEPKQDPPQALL